MKSRGAPPISIGVATMVGVKFGVARRRGAARACGRNSSASVTAATGLKQSKFRGAADIDLASGGKSHAGLAGMDGDDAAVHDEHARRARRSSVRGSGAAFDGNVIAFHAANCAGRRLLSASWREARNETSEQQEEQRQIPAGARMRWRFSCASELETQLRNGHLPGSPILYSSE